MIPLSFYTIVIPTRTFERMVATLLDVGMRAMARAQISYSSRRLFGAVGTNIYLGSSINHRSFAEGWTEYCISLWDHR